jgi:hypothetical protein
MTPRLVRRVFIVALCYTIALQTLLAAYATALTLTTTLGPAARFIVCHNAADNSSKSDGASLGVPCALCAIAASSLGLLPAPTPGVVAALVLAERIQIVDLTISFDRASSRTELARAPPYFT